VCVGLGVSSPAHAAEVAGYADGVIVGSAFVKLLLPAADGEGEPGAPVDTVAALSRVRELAEDLAAGVRRR
ncbi:hypothetical protein FNQ90_20475, partial [Streptomyces alkaliphilus]